MLHIRGAGSVEGHTRLLGEHNIQNILLAAAVASDLGLTLRQIAHGVEKLAPIKHRLELLSHPGNFTIINDAFNSNPVGAKAALEVLDAMAREEDDLLRYVNLFGYNPKYGVSGPRISSITYLPQGRFTGEKLYHQKAPALL